MADLILSEKYKAFLRHDAPVEFLEGTTAAGKTTVGIFKFMLKVAESPKRIHILSGLDLGTIEKNIINKELGIKDDFGDLVDYWPGGHGEYSLPHLEFHSSCGTKIVFVLGYDNKTRWKKALGGQYGCLYIDEINIADMEYVREVTMRCDYLMATLNPDDPGLPIYREYINCSRPLPEWAQDGFVTTFDFKSFGNDLAEMVIAGLGNIDWVQLTVDLAAGIAGLIDLCSGFLQGIDWAQLGTDLWDGLIGIITGIDWPGLIASAFELLMSGLAGSLYLYESICTSIQESLEAAWDSTVSYFDAFIEEAGGNIIQGLFDGIVAAFINVGQWIIDNIFKPFIDGFKAAFGIHSPSTVMEEQGGFIIEGLLGGITSAWESVTSFFDTALSDVETKLSEAFEGVKKTVSDIWENGIVPAIKDPVNSIITVINGLISGVVSGINTLIRAMNRIHFDIPEWVPGMGGKSFGFNISELSAPKIPMLADGAIITQPTLAMMGEYSGARNNPEIVAPQSIIAETVAAVMDDYAAANLAGQEAIVAVLREILEAVLGIEVGDDVIGQAVARYNRKMAIVRGGT